MKEKSIHLNIGGMTCVSCQNKIKKTLKDTNGVVKARVSYNQASADIVYNEELISKKEIINIIESLDYYIIKNNKVGKKEVIRISITLSVIVLLYYILQKTGILNLLVPSQLADTKMGYGMIFVIGLITSVHCIAMCGGINLSQCIHSNEEVNNKSKLSIFIPSLLYNLGRVVSYTLVGFVIGLIGYILGGGQEVGLSLVVQGILKIVAGFFMVIMGINMLDLFPYLRKFTIRVPNFIAKKVGTQKVKATRPFIVGLLNGFMPCGPLQSMWIVALATGNPFAGALSMFLFSIGTVPLMLGLGSIVSALGKKFTNKVMLVGSILVVVLGLAMISQGGSLSGFIPPDLLLILIIAICLAGIIVSIPIKKKVVRNTVKVLSLLLIVCSYFLWSYQGVLFGNKSTSNNSNIVDGVQVINSTLNASRYPDITVQAGIPVKWTINAPEGSVNGCNNIMIIQDLNIEKMLEVGNNVIEFTPTETGVINYSCWMGMVHGTITVTDELGNYTSNDNSNSYTYSDYKIPTDNLAVAYFNADDNGDQIQQVEVKLTDDGFTPSVIVVQKDIPLHWHIDNSMSTTTGNTKLLVPFYRANLNIKSGQNIVRINPIADFNVSDKDSNFYCYIKVVDDLSNINEEEIRKEISEFKPLIFPNSYYINNT